jgi:hypothetical protein
MQSRMRKLERKSAERVFNEERKLKGISFKEHEAIVRDAVKIISRHHELPEHDEVQLRCQPVKKLGVANYNVSLKMGDFPVGHVFFSLARDGRVRFQRLQDFSDLLPEQRKAIKIMEKDSDTAAEMMMRTQAKLDAKKWPSVPLRERLKRWLGF